MTLSYFKADPRNSRRSRWFRYGMAVLYILGMFVLAVAVVGVAAAITAFLGGPGVMAYVGLSLLMLLSSAAFARRGLARRRVASVFTYVARGARAGVPLPEFLQAAAEAEGGLLRRRLGAVARRISIGTPLAVALADELPELDTRQARLLATSEIAGATVDVADRLASEHARSSVDAVRQPRTQATYVAMLMLAVAGGASMLAVFVMPKFQRIMRDFGQPMPSVTSAVFDHRYFVPILLTFASLGAVGFLFLLFSPLVELTQRRGSARSESLRWEFVPWLWASRRHRLLADLYFAVANAVEAGVPLERTLGEVPGLDGSMSGTATKFARALSAGRPVVEAARSARLPAGDATMLGLASDTAHLGRACRFLAGHHDREAERSHQFLSAVVSVGMVFAAGAVVFVLVLTLWVPMISLIEVALKVSMATRR